MARLQAIQLDDNTVIYVQTTEQVEAPSSVEEIEEVRRGGSKGAFRQPAHQMAQSFTAIESTIRAYTTYTLSAFREMAVAEVRTVKLEFGVNVSGEGGIPYIATGTAGCNIKITVECAFPDSNNS